MTGRRSFFGALPPNARLGRCSRSVANAPTTSLRFRPQPILFLPARMRNLTLVVGGGCPIAKSDQKVAHCAAINRSIAKRRAALK